jgi:hypothetical protein
MNKDIEKAIRLLKQEVKHYETCSPDALTGIKVRLEELETAVKNCSITDVSQQRELLNALADNFNESTHTYVGQPMIEETLKAFNCG